ncbi:MAG: protein kinase [Proteobacteria bacterium]|nr:protein kinase [Pseudomonadota bacterium]
MSSDNVQALPAGTLIGDFRLDAVIGHGGFGITYRAFDTQLAKIVAIKEYLPVEYAVRDAGGTVVPRGSRYAEDFGWGLERFLDEARALARFRHLHIVPVLRYFEANGTAYTVMEFEDGRSVAELLRAPNDRVPADVVRRLAEGLLKGLATVHAQGFLHRDIKPANIIVRRTDGVPVLIDFGAARQVMGGRTRTLTNVMTPQYAPIEQYATDGKQGPWSDIYAAAAVLYQCIAGRAPPEAAARVGHDPYVPLVDLADQRYDRQFLAAIDHALAFAAPDRPQSIAEWAALFGPTIGRVADAPTQRLEPPTQPNPAASPASAGAGAMAPPRLGGARRAPTPVVVAEPAPRRRRRSWRWLIVLFVIVLAAGGLRRIQPLLDQVWARFVPPPATSTATAPSQPAPSQTPSPSPAPPSTPTQAATPSPRPPAAPSTARPSLAEPAGQAATAARALQERAEEASGAARAMAGEARIVAARAARPDLPNAERLSSDGLSYVGQVVDGKRQGLGVVELASGERQAGDFNDDRLNGLGTVRLADDTRYAGQWRDGQATGMGAREKPGVERTEGSFSGGRFDGLGTRRTLAEPVVVQSGEFRNDLLEGPGVEQVGGERYAGGFRNGKRHGYGQVTLPNGTVQSGRWDDGRLVEATP